jgi:hypothetical protein
MTLYNKDGSTYKLSSPNPIMKDQNKWSHFIVHNMEWKPEIKEDGTIVTPLGSDFEVKNDFFQDLDEAKETLEKQAQPVDKKSDQTVPAPKEPVVQSINIIKQNNVKDSDLSDIEKTFVYCLPAEIKEKKDKLYGDVFRTIQYKDPTSFEAVIISQSDMIIEIWSSVFFEQGSILYPRNGDKRWWRVQSKESKVGGWLMRATPSDHQPSFDS